MMVNCSLILVLIIVVILLFLIWTFEMMITCVIKVAVTSRLGGRLRFEIVQIMLVVVSLVLISIAHWVIILYKVQTSRLRLSFLCLLDLRHPPVSLDPFLLALLPLILHPVLYGGSPHYLHGSLTQLLVRILFLLLYGGQRSTFIRNWCRHTSSYIILMYLFL